MPKVQECNHIGEMELRKALAEMSYETDIEKFADKSGGGGTLTRPKANTCRLNM